MRNGKTEKTPNPKFQTKFTSICKLRKSKIYKLDQTYLNRNALKFSNTVKLLGE